MTAWWAPHVSCSESELVLAGNVGGKVWADGSAGPDLQPEPFCSTGLVAVGSACPGTKDEWIWKEGISLVYLGIRRDLYSRVHCWPTSHCSSSTFVDKHPRCLMLRFFSQYLLDAFSLIFFTTRGVPQK